MTVKLITFKTSQTVMADINDDKATTTVTMKKPVQVIVQPTKDGPMMGFAPFLDYAEEFSTGIEISKTDILCVTTPTPKFLGSVSTSLPSLLWSACSTLN